MHGLLITVTNGSCFTVNSSTGPRTDWYCCVPKRLLMSRTVGKTECPVRVGLTLAWLQVVSLLV